ncbi:50S ribosomal protein L24 [Candidatus Phytoplasma citri]|uniref:Large ribosomal subunit protein uL24 n=1 Tax=Candidatus Phytoplasma citri TaxID=180978 RepID=A0A1S9M399_9MOLU|nr:50S ribosomal protein L24 [Candidatus Phytoplasma aurantifolia]MDO8060012.1 50S ribosomal protein L24 [Candidatus Phytoplasma aurantifolia]MDO8078820.1 50S ribosomal protein L24 [Candidatus Phytoplasma aurantifolia]OOP59765.1 50S ribosomal protein L24 [Candidatus Phytoplasma aurantifolia]
MRIKKGDTVAIISGKDRYVIDPNSQKKVFRTGKVIKVFFKEQRVLVEGVNIAIKHKTSANDNDQKGQIIKEEMPIHVSNVALIDPDLKIPTRVGFRFDSDKKVRYSKKTGLAIIT